MLILLYSPFSHPKTLGTGPGRLNFRAATRRIVASPTQTAPLSKETVKATIGEGKAMLKDGKTNVEITAAMYQKLKSADRETIVAAFKEGAGLTDKGAVTYFYNCRRKTEQIATDARHHRDAGF
jgi:hypothetical protein